MNITITPDHVLAAAEAINGEYRERYAGRGMGSRECVAIDVDYESRDDIVRAIAEQILEEGELYDPDSGEFDPSDLLDAISEIGGRMRQDSMGRGVIYYFPSVSV